MNRYIPNMVLVNNRFSNFSDQATLDAKIKERDGYLTQISNIKAIYEGTKVDYETLQNTKEGTLVGALPYCTIHPRVCQQKASILESQRLLYENVKSTNEPKISSLNIEINALLKIQQAEAEIVTKDATLTPAQRQELERKRKELAAKLALEEQKQKDFVDLQKSKNKKIIIIAISIVIVLGITTGIIYFMKKRKSVKLAA